MVSSASRHGADRRGPSLKPVREDDGELAYLYRVIETIGSGPDLDAILRGVVHLATEATGCHACLIWFAEGDRLVLRSSSIPYAHLVGDISVGLGEGLVGWVAKTRRAAFIREKALEDPRVRYFPELEEERFQSLVSVPMFDRNADVMGVISLHAEAPHEFARADLDFLENTASLMAGAVENARLYEQATARVTLLREVSELSQRIASAASVEAVLRAVSDGAVSLLGADRAEIYLFEPDERLTLRVASPALSRRAPEPEILPARHGGNLPESIWGPSEDAAANVVPLIVGDERLGVLAVSLADTTPEAATTLSAVAAHASVAIRRHQVIEALQETNLAKDLFQGLATDGSRPDLSDLADRLSIDLDAPHLVLHVMEGGAASRERARDTSAHRQLPWRALADRAEARLSGRFRGSLFDHHERSIRALVPLADESPQQAIEAIREMGWSSDQGPGLSVGVSNPCRGTGSFAKGLREAASAAEVGALIRGGPGVATYDDLGPYRYVLGSEEGDRDRFQQALKLVLDYDERRGTQLLHTLEGYLDHRGNVVATARALYIHANTLRQRLDRIQRVSGLDLEADDWLSLAVAAKVVKLRKLRETAGTKGD
jgi:GAF domain-containing protein